MKGIEDTSTDNFADIIGNNRKFIVPIFQRDYSWNEEQWDDLWQDIKEMIEEKGDHYMGYLVLQSIKDNGTSFKIIDGQQRFTTITLIILAVIKAIKLAECSDDEKKANEVRANSLMNTYVGRQDPVSLEYDNILELNRNNNDYYKDYIVKLGDLRARGLISSEKLLKKCFEWFFAKVTALQYSGEKYAEFILKIVNNLFFTVITVNDDMNAFRVFETLNARGVQLSSADLLKNYLFSLVDDGDHKSKRVNELERIWNRLAQNVKTEKLPDFIRYYWNTKHKSVRSGDLFKAVRKEITEAKAVFMMVHEMMDYSDIYMALKDYTDETWNGHKEESSEIELLSLFGLKQPFSLLMTSYLHLSFDEFSKILKKVIVVCFRYNVICGKNPNEIESVFNAIAMSISRGENPGLNKLQKIYVNDIEFENSFATKSFTLIPRNVKVIRYILGKIEHVVSGNAMIDIHDDSNSIEHILPQNPTDDWGMDEFKAEQFINRLGNLCLLKKKDNKELENKPYADKKKVYSRSTFETTKSIPEHYDVWNEASINSRQGYLAHMAKGIWKL